MEPIVKYENCDNMYATTTLMRDSTIAHKRHFNELTNDNMDGNYQHGNFMSHLQNEFQSGGFYPPPNQQQHCAKPTKRFRRGESAVLFAPPFFELPDEIIPEDNGTVTARCLSCRVMLRGHKNVSSNFLKHMKRLHPEIYKIYENYKIFKQRGFTSTNEMHSLNQTTPNTTTENTFFGSSTFLDNMTVNSNVSTADAAGEEEQNSETTDNSGTAANSSTDVPETNDNSLDSQRRDKVTKPAIRTNADTSTEIDLSQKTLAAMGKLFDEKLKGFVKKSELNSITRNMSNADDNTSQQNAQCLRAEVQSPLHTMQTQFNNLKNEFQAMQRQMQQMTRSKRYLQRELETLERVAQRRKIVVRNLKLADNQNPSDALEQLFKERFELSNIVMLNVIPIANKNKTQNGKQSLLVELKNEKDVRAIFRKASCLKNTGIFIEPQMSLYSRKRKEKLLVLRREMLRRNNELHVMVRNTQLTVCGKQFYWDDVLGLCAGNLDCPLDDDDVDPVEELKKLTKLDLKEFLNVLKNYNVR